MARERISGLDSCKQGNVTLDAALFLIVVVAFAVIVMISYSMFSDMKTDLTDDLTLSESDDVINEVDGRYPKMFDALVIFLFFGMWAMAIVASFLVDSHPIFFIFSVVLLILLIIASIFIANFYDDLFNDATLVAMKASFPATNWILTHLLMYVLVVGASVALVLYGKSRQ